MEVTAYKECHAEIEIPLLMSTFIYDQIFWRILKAYQKACILSRNHVAILRYEKFELKVYYLGNPVILTSKSQSRNAYLKSLYSSHILQNNSASIGFLGKVLGFINLMFTVNKCWFYQY